MDQFLLKRGSDISQLRRRKPNLAVERLEVVGTGKCLSRCRHGEHFRYVVAIGGGSTAHAEESGEAERRGAGKQCASLQEAASWHLSLQIGVHSESFRYDDRE